ncbi:hypothetical protein N7478_003204 [Penicillium angulare]|uniref:uncharacterized protein n=1 Tax=Penicillium angulare TaxID=116970 RepID=UPI002540B1E9|nr:uncharacterized protein N7478_003204 [Penicillium angulare]KAJ5287518.1 hypothetical protein N7478_003204 [Penicillium angulare]
MYRSASSSPFALTLLTSSLANLNPTSLESLALGALPDLLDVSSATESTTPTLAFHPAYGEVTWVGVPGPS